MLLHHISTSFFNFSGPPLSRRGNQNLLPPFKKEGGDQTMGGTCLLDILNVFKEVLSEGKLVLVGEFICIFLWCLKFRKKFSSVPSKEKKPYVRKKLPVTKLRIIKSSCMFLKSQSFQCYDNRIETIKNEWYFV